MRLLAALCILALTALAQAADLPIALQNGRQRSASLPASLREDPASFFAKGNHYCRKFGNNDRSRSSNDGRDGSRRRYSSSTSLDDLDSQSSPSSSADSGESESSLSASLPSTPPSDMELTPRLRAYNHKKVPPLPPATPLRPILRRMCKSADPRGKRANLRQRFDEENLYTYRIIDNDEDNHTYQSEYATWNNNHNDRIALVNWNDNNNDDDESRLAAWNNKNKAHGSDFRIWDSNAEVELKENPFYDSDESSSAEEAEGKSVNTPYSRRKALAVSKSKFAINKEEKEKSLSDSCSSEIDDNRPPIGLSSIERHRGLFKEASHALPLLIALSLIVMLERDTAALHLPRVGTMQAGLWKNIAVADALLFPLLASSTRKLAPFLYSRSKEGYHRAELELAVQQYFYSSRRFVRLAPQNVHMIKRNLVESAAFAPIVLMLAILEHSTGCKNAVLFTLSMVLSHILAAIMYP